MREKSITALSHYGRYIVGLLLFFRAVMFSIRRIIQHGKAALTVEWTVGPARYVVEQIKECVSAKGNEDNLLSLFSPSRTK